MNETGQSGASLVSLFTYNLLIEVLLYYRIFTILDRIGQVWAIGPPKNWRKSRILKIICKKYRDITILSGEGLDTQTKNKVKIK